MTGGGGFFVGLQYCWDGVEALAVASQPRMPF